MTTTMITFLHVIFSVVSANYGDNIPAYWKDYEKAWQCNAKFDVYPNASQPIMWNNPRSRDPQQTAHKMDIPRDDARSKRLCLLAHQIDPDLSKKVCWNIGITVLSGDPHFS
jgi:hypothetical protein